MRVLLRDRGDVDGRDSLAQMPQAASEDQPKMNRSERRARHQGDAARPGGETARMKGRRQSSTLIQPVMA